MKRFLISIFLFSLFSIVIYVSTVFVFGKILPADFRPNIHNYPRMYGTTKNMLTELDTLKCIDILIVGASDAYRSYDPRVFEKNGIKIFNAGTSSQTPFQTYTILLDRLVALKPKLVLYEVSPVCFELDGVESTIDLILNGYKPSSTFNMVVSDPEIQTINSFIFDLVDKRVFRNELKDFKSNKELYIGKGFVEMAMSTNPINDLPDKFWVPQKKQIQYYEAILKLLKEYKIPYLVVNAPSVIDRSYSNGHSFDSLFKKSSNFISGVYNNNFDSGRDLFDPSHLNQCGVIKWDSTLITILKKNYRF